MLELNTTAIQAARTRIHSGQYTDPRYTSARPIEPAEIADYIDRHGWSKYASWFIAVDINEDEHSAFRYRFPYGDLDNVSKAQLERSLQEANRYGDFEIERAISQLLQTLDED